MTIVASFVGEVHTGNSVLHRTEGYDFVGKEFSCKDAKNGGEAGPGTSRDSPAIRFVSRACLLEAQATCLNRARSPYEVQYQGNQRHD